MKKELRVGNLIINDYGEVQPVYGVDEKSILTKVDENGWSICFKPKGIELTDEWLLKLGFDLLFSSKFRKSYDFAKDLRFGYSDNFGLANTPSAVTFVGNSFSHIKYVHELQNLYFCLTGIELTIA